MRNSESIDFFLHLEEFGKKHNLFLLFDENIHNTKINDVNPNEVVDIKYSFSKDALEIDMIPTNETIYIEFIIER